MVEKRCSGVLLLMKLKLFWIDFVIDIGIGMLWLCILFVVLVVSSLLVVAVVDCDLRRIFWSIL